MLKEGCVKKMWQASWYQVYEILHISKGQGTFKIADIDGI